MRSLAMYVSEQNDPPGRMMGPNRCTMDTSEYALVPMAAQPTEMSSRNWMMRRLIIDTIKADPDLGPAFDETIVLEPGMVLVLEPVIWEDGEGGWRHDPERGTERRLVCRAGNAFALPAKDRSGQLELLEPPNLRALIDKCAAATRIPTSKE